MIADLQNAYINAVERVGASTVNVSTAGAAYGPPFGRPWPRRGFGSGVLLDAQGHVLTTHHVVEGASKVIVTFADGRVLSGTVVGGDDETDIAIIKVDGKDFHAAEFAGYELDRRVAADYGITSRQGVFLAEVSSGSPAEAAGLQVGDVLTSLGGRALGGVADLVDGLRERAIGDTIDIQAERRGQALRVKAKLASRPF